MAEKTIEKSKLLWGMVFVLIGGLLLGFFINSIMSKEKAVEEKEFKDLSIDEKRTHWMEEADAIRGELAIQGKYSCCLEKPCWYCIQKTSGHGEGATCECLNDILNGEHPCGECIGEILEGHGLKDKAIVSLYAKAIAHKVGEQHTGHLKEIIADMYDISVEEQL